MMVMTEIKPERGDVILVLFPHSDLQTAKLRPALVVQANALQTGLPQLIVAMITSRMAPISLLCGDVDAKKKIPNC